MKNSGWVVGRPVLLIVAYICGPLATGAEDDNRSSMPEAASVEAAEKLVRDVFGDEHSQARSTPDKKALANKILAAAIESTSAPAEQFVLFRVARDIAASAADADTAFKAVEGMGQRFRIDSLQIKLAVLDTISAKARLPSDHKALLPHFGAVFDVAIASERFDVARQVHKLAMASAVKTRDVAARKKAVARLKELDELEKKFAAVKQALAVLDERPTDPDANLVVGRYRCFLKGDWKAGLPMLALGGDAKLKELATKELGGTCDPSEQVMIGDGWWKLADELDGEEQFATRHRATHWYRQSVATLDGLTRVRIAKRIEQIDTAAQRTEPAGETQQVYGGRQPIDVLRVIDIEKDTIKGTWHFDKNVLIVSGQEHNRIHIPYIPPAEYLLEVVATRAEGANAFAVGLPGGGKHFVVVLDTLGGKRSSFGKFDRWEANNNPNAWLGTVLAQGRPTRILYHVHKQGVRVDVAGQTIIDWRQGFDRFSTSQYWRPKDARLPFIGSKKDEFHVSSIRLTPISGPARPARPSK